MVNEVYLLNQQVEPYKGFVYDQGSIVYEAIGDTTVLDGIAMWRGSRTVDLADVCDSCNSGCGGCGGGGDSGGGCSGCNGCDGGE